ncbi:MAG TPA: Maf family protein [Terriglobales bacterium]|jgi:septum formation protein
MLILASASPRRREILTAARIPFTVQVANVPEAPRADENPEQYARRLACEKAQAVRQQNPSSVVLGADTIVVVDGAILEKPVNDQDAARMLRRLSGRTHQVLTGVCLAGSGFEDTRLESTTVTMQRLSDEEIRGYVSTGEPKDKAGAYAIQGIASRWISRIEGDYFNVVGLPVSLVYRMLLERGCL